MHLLPSTIYHASARGLPLKPCIRACNLPSTARGPSCCCCCCSITTVAPSQLLIPPQLIHLTTVASHWSSLLLHQPSRCSITTVATIAPASPAQQLLPSGVIPVAPSQLLLCLDCCYHHNCCSIATVATQWSFSGETNTTSSTHESTTGAHR